MIENDETLESDVGSSERSTSLFRLLDRLFLPVDNASITLFRIGLGAMFAWWAWDYFASGLVHSIYIEPKFHFTYWPFGWVHPLQPNGMIAVFVAIILLGILVCAGVFYRWSSLLLALCFTYVFLLERTNYQNHYYLLILIAWWLPWLPLAKNVSYDASRNSSGFESTTQAWALWLLRFHIGLPYVYGGLAKLHGDWLAGEPMRQILASRNQLPFVGPWFNEEWVVFAFVWGGLLFDLAIVPLLLFKRTHDVARQDGSSAILRLGRQYQSNLHPKAQRGHQRGSSQSISSRPRNDIAVCSLSCSGAQRPNGPSSSRSGAGFDISQWEEAATLYRPKRRLGIGTDVCGLSKVDTAIDGATP